MPQDSASGSVLGGQHADVGGFIEPSIRNALPHFIPVLVFPLILAAIAFGGWWLLPPIVFFMSATAAVDRAIGLDGKNMDPVRTPERKLRWHNIPAWLWALLWPPTLIFGLWQILVSDAFALWEDLLLVYILAVEAQAVFIVGHELVHRRRKWERRLGEVLLASASYPQYSTEHVYIHHAQVGTPQDAGSVPKGVSFWTYFPREVVSNITGSWRVIRERLARKRLPVWHVSNPFWRYGVLLAFWWGLTYWMGGAWAVLVFIGLGMFCVFSMKLSNYLQHYGLRRVRLPNGRWEKIMPRHSWSADWQFSNWLFFNMQRHADHHALASRPYPLLQCYKPEESPTLPGPYGEMMFLVMSPKRWFKTMDPLVDQWRAHFYPEIKDWSAYDSPVSIARPDAFDTIIEIYAAAPRLARAMEGNPELLDTLKDREFTDLDLPKGFGPDPESESIARRGLTRLYWTREMDVPEMKSQIAEIPAADALETAEVVRNFTNDKAFQVGMHGVRGNLVPDEAKIALSNLAEAAVSTVLAAVVADFTDRHGPMHDSGLTGIFLGALADREVFPEAPLELLLVHDGLSAADGENLCKRIREALAALAGDSLIFASSTAETDSILALPLAALAERCRDTDSETRPETVPDLAQTLDRTLDRTLSIYETGDAAIGSRFDTLREETRGGPANSGAPRKPSPETAEDNPETE